MNITNYQLLITDVPALKPKVDPGKDGFIDIREWDGEMCRLETDWNYLFQSDQIVIQSTIKTGFETDGGSIPRLFRNIISPKGRGLLGFLPHDAYYGTYYLPQYIADNVLAAICDISGLGSFKVNSIYYSLRACGHFAYENKIKLDKHTKKKHPYYGIYRTREYVDFELCYICDEWKESYEKLQEQVEKHNPNKG